MLRARHRGGGLQLVVVHLRARGGGVDPQIVLRRWRPDRRVRPDVFGVRRQARVSGSGGCPRVQRPGHLERRQHDGRDAGRQRASQRSPDPDAQAGERARERREHRRQVRIRPALRLGGGGVGLGDRERAVQQRPVAAPRGRRHGRERQPAGAGDCGRSGVHELPRRDGDHRSVHGRVAHARADRRLQRLRSAQHHLAGRFPRRRLLRFHHRQLLRVAQLPPVGRHHVRPAEGDHHVPPVAHAGVPEGVDQHRRLR